MIETMVVRPSTSLRTTSCSLALIAPDSSTLIVRGPCLAVNVAMIAAVSSLPRTALSQNTATTTAATRTAPPISLVVLWDPPLALLLLAVMSDILWSELLPQSLFRDRQQVQIPLEL